MSTEDLNKYNALAQQQAKKLFPTLNMSKFYAAENADPLVFCHFAENIQDQIYDQVGRVPSIRKERLHEAPSVPTSSKHFAPFGRAPPRRMRCTSMMSLTTPYY